MGADPGLWWQEQGLPGYGRFGKKSGVGEVGGKQRMRGKGARGPEDILVEIPEGSLLAKQNVTSLSLGEPVFSHAQWGWQYLPHNVGAIHCIDIYLAPSPVLGAKDSGGLLLCKVHRKYRGS